MGVVHDGLHGQEEVVFAFFRVSGPAGLQVVVGSSDAVILREVLAQVYQLEFVAAGKHHGIVAAVADACFG